MGCNHDADTDLIKLREEIDNFLRQLMIKAACWLIGEWQWRLVDHRPGYAHSLLLTTIHRVRDKSECPNHAPRLVSLSSETSGWGPPTTTHPSMGTQCSISAALSFLDQPEGDEPGSNHCSSRHQHIPDQTGPHDRLVRYAERCRHTHSAIRISP